MLYLDYAKPLTDGKYILNFFAESIEDLDSISHGQRFITKNGTDYGVPQPSSTVVITMPDKTKRTYVLDESLEWQEGGVDMDYSKLENAPIILANITEEGFVPEANTYYEHLGETTGDFVKGIIYLYDGTEYKAIDGSGSGGIQPDYNQNDSTAADYIKNRPFYSETSLTEIANLQVVSGSLKEVGELTVEYNGERFTGAVTDDGEESFYTIVIQQNNFVLEGCVSKSKEDFLMQFGHKNSYNIKIGDKVIFNGVQYEVKSVPSGDDAGKPYISDGELNFEDYTPSTATFLFIFLNDFYDGFYIETFATFTSTNIDFNLKVAQQTIKTIDPKFIKDMYYETTTETQLFNGVVDINTEKQSSGETYYTGTLSPSFTFGVSGDKCEVSINGTSYTLDVVTLGTVSVAGIQDFSNGIPVYLETDSDGVTTIGSKTSYTGATLVIKNIHTDIKQIPAKYVPQGGEVVEISVTEMTDAAIQTALETHLKANKDIAKRLSESSSFTLKVKKDNTVISYIFTANNADPTFAALIGSWFTSIAVEDDVFSNNRLLKNTIVRIESDGSVKFITSIIYDNNLFFGIPDTEGMNQDESEFAKLGFYKRGEVALTAVSNTILLHEWITLAQQRDDFVIPTPTKDTDLVDKKFVSNAISTAVTNSITTALNTEV